MNTMVPTLVIIDMQKGMADPAAGPRNNPDAERNLDGKYATITTTERLLGTI